MDAVAMLAALSTVAFVVESATEYLFGSWLNGNILRWVAFALGVAVCLFYHLNVLAMLGIQADTREARSEEHTSELQSH